MPKNSTLLPIAVVMMIVVVITVVMFTARTNAPSIQGDMAYPHHVCTFDRYCVGPACSDAPNSFIAYLTHLDGKPRVEMTWLNPRVTMEETNEGMVFTSTGGELSGTLRIYNNRALDFEGISQGEDGQLEHYGSGSCDRLRGG